MYVYPWLSFPFDFIWTTTVKVWRIIWPIFWQFVCHKLSFVKRIYPRRTRSMNYKPVPWLPASPGHQQARSWLCQGHACCWPGDKLVSVACSPQYGLPAPYQWRDMVMYIYIYIYIYIYTPIISAREHIFLQYNVPLHKKHGGKLTLAYTEPWLIFDKYYVSQPKISLEIDLQVKIKKILCDIRFTNFGRFFPLTSLCEKGPATQWVCCKCSQDNG